MGFPLNPKAPRGSELLGFLRVLESTTIDSLVPIVSIVVPFFGLTSSILRIPQDKPEKELQWRLLSSSFFGITF